MAWGNRDASFITVTVQKSGQSSKKAGDTDVSVAQRVLGFAHQLWNDEQNPRRKERYWDIAQDMEGAIQRMIPDREDVIWWLPGDDTAKNEMEYTCATTNAKARRWMIVPTYKIKVFGEDLST